VRNKEDNGALELPRAPSGYEGAYDRETGPSAMDRTTQDRIGNALRTLYDGLLSEPVPPRFADLIRKLDSGRPGGGLQ